jgi:hypothetical protein
MLFAAILLMFKVQFKIEGIQAVRGVVKRTRFSDAGCAIKTDAEDRSQA